MGANTKIEWSDDSFNIVWGCDKVSEACKNCYAEATAKREGLAVWGPQAPRRVMSGAYWRKPLGWNRKAERQRQRRLVLCCSMADVAEDHPTVNRERERLWPLIRQTTWLDWALLTKRPENLSRIIPWRDPPWPNVWLGATVENRRHYDRIHELVRIPAVVRFLSLEPLLESVSDIPLDGIGWVIVGGESGWSFRPMRPDWARQVRDRCVAQGIPFFFKQWADVWPERLGRLLDGREWNEFPKGRTPGNQLEFFQEQDGGGR